MSIFMKTLYEKWERYPKHLIHNISKLLKQAGYNFVKKTFTYRNFIHYHFESTKTKIINNKK